MVDAVKCAVRSSKVVVSYIFLRSSELSLSLLKLDGARAEVRSFEFLNRAELEPGAGLSRLGSITPLPPVPCFNVLGSSHSMPGTVSILQLQAFAD